MYINNQCWRTDCAGPLPGGVQCSMHITLLITQSPSRGDSDPDGDLLAEVRNGAPNPDQMGPGQPLPPAKRCGLQRRPLNYQNSHLCPASQSLGFQMCSARTSVTGWISSQINTSNPWCSQTIKKDSLLFLAKTTLQWKDTSSPRLLGIWSLGSDSESPALQCFCPPPWQPLLATQGPPGARHLRDAHNPMWRLLSQEERSVLVRDA